MVNCHDACKRTYQQKQMVVELVIVMHVDVDFTGNQRIVVVR